MTLRVAFTRPEDKIAAVIRALKQVHPYETPAFQHWSVETE